MITNSVFDYLVRCEILITRNKRVLNRSGIYTNEPEDQNSCIGYITPKELDELKLEEENSVGVQLLNVYFKGDVEVDLNDELTVDDKKYVVKQKIFRPQSQHTRLLVSLIERKSVSNQ